jgi:hypothetical protein
MKLVYQKLGWKNGAAASVPSFLYGVRGEDMTAL